MDLTKLSRYISLILRHEPWAADVTLGERRMADEARPGGLFEAGMKGE